MALWRLPRPPQRNIIFSSAGDFEDLVMMSSIYVDKSLFIEEMIESTDHVTLITMPRRWGNTTNLRMLQAFLEVQIDQSGNELIDKTNTLRYKLFAGGSIITDEGPLQQKITIKPSKLAKKSPRLLSAYQGMFPVVYLDFQNCSGENITEITSNLSVLKTQTIDAFWYLEKSKMACCWNAVGSEYRKLVQECSILSFQDTILRLCRLLKAHHFTKVWILVDEYDAAVNRAFKEFDYESARKVANMFGRIYLSLFKGNPYLYKGVFTGIQYVGNSGGTLSVLNNAAKHNIRYKSKYSKYYGINEEELNILIDHFSITDTERVLIREWYGGYHENIGSANNIFIEKYNIYSVVEYLNRRVDGFVSCFGNSGSIDFMAVLLNKKQYKERLEILVSGGNLAIYDLRESFSATEFFQLKDLINGRENKHIVRDGFDLILRYLYIAGYLIDAVDNPYECRFPNRDVRNEFAKYLKVHNSFVDDRPNLIVDSYSNDH